MHKKTENVTDCLKNAVTFFWDRNIETAEQSFGLRYHSNRIQICHIGQTSAISFSISDKICQIYILFVRFVFIFWTCKKNKDFFKIFWKLLTGIKIIPRIYVTVLLNKTKYWEF